MQVTSSYLGAIDDWVFVYLWNLDPEIAEVCGSDEVAVTGERQRSA